MAERCGTRHAARNARKVRASAGPAVSLAHSLFSFPYPQWPTASEADIFPITFNPFFPHGGPSASCLILKISRICLQISPSYEILSINRCTLTNLTSSTNAMLYRDRKQIRYQLWNPERWSIWGQVSSSRMTHELRYIGHILTPFT